MNLLHMKYAVEIAETKSINKAAEKLYVGQSALSRAIKELEASLGVVLFERSAKGMFLTPDGETFVRYAKSVLKQVDAIENLFKKYAKMAVPSKKITPHKLRSTYGTALYRQTGDIRLVADVLGHENVNTTIDYYAAIEDEHKRRAANAVSVRKTPPQNNIDNP